MRDPWSLLIIGITLVALAWIAKGKKHRKRVRIVITVDDGNETEETK